MSITCTLEEVGGFNNGRNQVVGSLRAETVDRETAPARLVSLKEKFNELQEKREVFRKLKVSSSRHSRVFLGFSTVAEHRKSMVNRIVEEMKKCVTQINILRTAFCSSQDWHIAEGQVILDHNAFDDETMLRELLLGAL